MHGTLPTAADAAISSAPGSGIEAVPEAGPNPGTGIDDDWFYNCAVTVFGSKETGQLLHLATGWPRTSCYAMVARDADQRRKPNPDFLRILFRSDHGAPFHAAFMHGCGAPWWCEDQRARDVGRDVIARVERK
jgi:hypothetical protein